MYLSYPDKKSLLISPMFLKTARVFENTCTFQIIASTGQTDAKGVDDALSCLENTS